MIVKTEKPHALDQRQRPMPPLSLRDPSYLQRNLHVLDEGPPGEEIIPLRDVADLGVDPGDGPVAKEDPTGTHREEAHDEIEERGLSAPGGPHHRDKLPLLEGEGDGVEGHNLFPANMKLLADTFNSEQWRHRSRKG